MPISSSPPKEKPFEQMILPNLQIRFPFRILTAGFLGGKLQNLCLGQSRHVPIACLAKNGSDRCEV